MENSRDKRTPGKFKTFREFFRYGSCFFLGIFFNYPYTLDKKWGD